MKTPRRHHHTPPKELVSPADELSSVKCEICGAPYRLMQRLNLPRREPGPAYGAYVQTCKCERPAPPQRDYYDPDVPF